jgi:hypothetical protein
VNLFPTIEAHHWRESIARSRSYTNPVSAQILAMSTQRHIPFGSIKFDSATQIRAEIDSGTVEDYAEHMKAGDVFPAADVFDADGEYYIGDGWHRLLAAQKNGDVTFPCLVHPGGRHAAIKFALSANAKHGLKRTNADKRKAVTVALAEFPNLSDRQLAELCGVSNHMVAAARSDVGNSPTSHRMDSLGRMQPATKPATMRHEPRGEPEEKEPAEEAPAVGGSLEDIEQTARETKRERFHMPSRGMFIARGAVNQLETILPTDGERLQALMHVRDWCNEQISLSKK